MAKITLRHDAPCDVLYVKGRSTKTANVPISPDEILCVDPEALEREGAEEFFELFLLELNASLSTFRSTKALLDFLKHERVGLRARIPA